MQTTSRRRDHINIAFQARDEFFREIFDAVQSGLIIIDTDTHIILEANAAAVAMIGHRKEHVVGSVCHNYICPADKGHCPITDLGQVVDRSERMLLLAGETIIPIVKSVGFITIGGRRCLLENFVDNTEHKKTEIAAKESERKVHAIFDQTFPFIGLLSPEGLLLDMNRSSRNPGPPDGTHLISRPFWKMPWRSPTDDQINRIHEAVRSAAGGTFVRFESTGTGTAGNMLWFDVSIKPVLGEHGAIAYLIAECRDITDLKATETALVESENLYRAIFGNTGTAH